MRSRGTWGTSEIGRGSERLVSNIFKQKNALRYFR